VIYQIEFTETVRELLGDISDRRIQAKIVERIAALAQDPEKQGKPLADELDGYRSVRAVGQRYRIIYRVDGDKVLVLIVVIGIRKEGDKKDVYRLAQRLVRLGILEGKPEEPTPDDPTPEAPGEEQPTDPKE
jgi:mRNA interferase RelE/StbE